MKFRELCIKYGPLALEIIMEIAERGEPDLARFAAAKFVVERGYGVNPDDAHGASATVVNVITGVREGAADLPQRVRPIMPDGRNPLEQPPAPPDTRLRPEPEKMEDFTTWPKPANDP